MGPEPSSVRQVAPSPHWVSSAHGRVQNARSVGLKSTVQKTASVPAHSPPPTVQWRPTPKELPRSQGPAQPSSPAHASAAAASESEPAPEESSASSPQPASATAIARARAAAFRSGLEWRPFSSQPAVREDQYVRISSRWARSHARARS